MSLMQSNRFHAASKDTTKRLPITLTVPGRVIASGTAGDIRSERQSGGRASARDGGATYLTSDPSRTAQETRRGLPWGPRDSALTITR